MRLGAARQQLELEMEGAQWKRPRRGDFGSVLSWGLARLAGRIAGVLIFFADLLQRFSLCPRYRRRGDCLLAR